jgi:hypothetical protein
VISAPRPHCSAVNPASHQLAKDWRSVPQCVHFVQFYTGETELIDSLAGFISDAIWQSERALVIATPEHRAALEEQLRRRGVDLFSATSTQQYLAFDAVDTLAKFMRGGRPDRLLFFQHVGDLVRHATRGGRRLRAFGEMVAVLWAEGNGPGALELEQLWNELGRECAFSLFCAYPANAAPTESGATLAQVCASHARVIVPE